MNPRFPRDTEHGRWWGSVNAGCANEGPRRASHTVNGLRMGFWPEPQDHAQVLAHLPPPLGCTLDGGLGLAVEVACGAERAAGAGHARRHPHAHPFQVPEAVGERLGLVLQLLPVSCRARGAISRWVPRVSGGKKRLLRRDVLPEVEARASARRPFVTSNLSLGSSTGSLTENGWAATLTSPAFLSRATHSHT